MRGRFSLVMDVKGVSVMGGLLTAKFKDFDQDWWSDYFYNSYDDLTQDQIEALYGLEIEALCDLIKELDEEDGFSLKVRRPSEVPDNGVRGFDIDRCSCYDFEIVVRQEEGNAEYQVVLPGSIKFESFTKEELLEKLLDTEMFGGDDIDEDIFSNFLERYQRTDDRNKYTIPYTTLSKGFHKTLALTAPDIGDLSVKKLFVSNIAHELVDAKLEYQHRRNASEAFERNGVSIEDVSL